MDFETGCRCFFNSSSSMRHLVNSFRAFSRAVGAMRRVAVNEEKLLAAGEGQKKAVPRAWKSCRN